MKHSQQTLNLGYIVIIIYVPGKGPLWGNKAYTMVKCDKNYQKTHFVWPKMILHYVC